MVSSHFNIDRFLAGKPLAITEAGLEELKAHALARLAMFDAEPSATLENLVAQMAERQTSSTRRTATGVIPIHGTISQRAQGDTSAALAGGAATEDIAAQLRTLLADDEVSKIILDIDSPGGSSYGVAELAQEIYQSRGQKPIVAVANSLAASAAYWIGASADHFYATPGGVVGSIGVYAVHQDISKMADEAGVKTTLISAGKYKTMGNQFEPLADEARDRIQSRVNEVYEQFVQDVARGRGVSAETVRKGYGEGDVLSAKKAKAEGMVDGIMTFDQVVAHTFRIRRESTGTAAEAFGPMTIWGLPVIEEDVTPTDDSLPPQDNEASARRQRMRTLSFKARAAAGAA